MDSIAVQIATYLSYKGLCNFTPEDVTGNTYIDQLPEGNNLVSIFNTKGVKSDIKDYRSLGIQIIYRGDSNPIESYNIADGIFLALQRFTGYFTTTGNKIVDCYSLSGGGAELIGQDNNGSYEYSMNFIVDHKV